MYLIIFLLFLTSCARDYIDTTDLILTKQSKRICKEENLRVCGMGGAMIDRVTEVTVKFTADRKVDLSEARRLIVKCIEELRNSLNSNDQIIEYLSPYPFPSSAMNVGISFIKKSGGLLDYGCVDSGTGGVSCVFQINDKLYYCSHNPCTQILEDYYEEPYEVALEIVRNRGALDTPCGL
jgi:hypothetical protein